ncbi:FUSC family protein [Chelatococcus sp. YT9]|uniref:FUSC family protein n=1 Tax=Chelatococcus sp. YT9 TaxID=2835635 RepID=UPI001BD094EA|nr:FUSC family protein [Chelatococcus sp. YT9]MBS7701528.1 FUSC family protein [Chelatococcus sp. YT9]
MSVTETSRSSLWPSFPVDLSWRNWVFALRTAVAGVVALAIAYWLEMQDPQWSILTVYLLAQPTAGGALAKSTYRIIGTIAGACVGLVILALYAQAPIPLVGAVALWLGASFYVAARLRNYASYGWMLAGYTALLVALEGAANPLQAWSIAVDRTGEIIIGIACASAATVLVMPRYAGVLLREQMARLFCDLSHYGAIALRRGTPPETFAALRRAMVEKIVGFDALRSYAMFEAPEMRADDVLMRRAVHEFLGVLAVARGLYTRIDDFKGDAAASVIAHMQPALDETAKTLQLIADDPKAFADPHRVRAALVKTRASLGTAATGLETLAGRVPFEQLADGLLILHRAGDLLHGLSMVMVSEAASLRRQRASNARRPPEALASSSHAEAALIGARAALAIILGCVVWAATGWKYGFTALTGIGLALCFAVNQDRPGKLGLPVMLWTVLAIAVAYSAMVFVLPRIEGFEAFALFVIAALIPGGLMAGTPQTMWPGIMFAGFIGAQLGTGNKFQPNDLIFFNANMAFVLGIAACLGLIALLPVTSMANRARFWTMAVGRLLPDAARGARHERKILSAIVDMMAELLPRLSLDRPGDEDFLRGALGAASMSLELGRLNRLRQAPELSPEVAVILADFLNRFAAALEVVPRAGEQRAAWLAEAEFSVRSSVAALGALPLEPGSAAALAIRAAASLRFISDRFEIDRAFLLLPVAEA